MLLVNKFKKSYTRIGGGSNQSGPEVPEGLLKKCNICHLYRGSHCQSLYLPKV